MHCASRDSSTASCFSVDSPATYWVRYWRDAVLQHLTAIRPPAVTAPTMWSNTSLRPDLPLLLTQPCGPTLPCNPTSRCYWRDTVFQHFSATRPPAVTDVPAAMIRHVIFSFIFGLIIELLNLRINKAVSFIPLCYLLSQPTRFALNE